jgi:hypothetical protein
MVSSLVIDKFIDMKKIIIAFIASAVFLVNAGDSFAQGDAASVAATVSKMQEWNSAAWQNFFSTFKNTDAGTNAPHVKAMYELDAYLHAASLDKSLKNKAVAIVVKGLSQLKNVSEKNILVRAYLLERLGYLGSDKAVHTLSNYIEVTGCTDVATMSLATIGSKKSLAALEAALVKATSSTRPAIEAAIKHAKSVLPSIQAVALTPDKAVHPAQRLLDLQDQMD